MVTLTAIAMLLAVVGGYLWGRKFDRRLALLESGYGIDAFGQLANIHGARKQIGAAEAAACEGAERAACSCVCLGVLHGVKRVKSVYQLPAGDPHRPADYVDAIAPRTDPE
jgi:hypothetical protein